ncbi:MAG: hypothetical protein DDT22_00150 [candidate division WS2 bacterium]|nr:hypothetical protein [Candidatus Lithacetigena glycinireducens]
MAINPLLIKPLVISLNPNLIPKPLNRGLRNKTNKNRNIKAPIAEPAAKPKTPKYRERIK